MTIPPPHRSSVLQPNPVPRSFLHTTSPLCLERAPLPLTLAMCQDRGPLYAIPAASSAGLSASFSRARTVSSLLLYPQKLLIYNRCTGDICSMDGGPQATACYKETEENKG